MNSAQRSKPYFFSFNFKSKPGRMLADCVRFESVDMPSSSNDTTQYTLLGADYDTDLRIRNAFESASTFVLRNQTTDKAKRLVKLLKQVEDCCNTEAWQLIDADEVTRLIKDLGL